MWVDSGSSWTTCGGRLAGMIMGCFVPAATGSAQPVVFFFFNDTATTEIYTLSLHDALPISIFPRCGPGKNCKTLKT